MRALLGGVVAVVLVLVLLPNTAIRWLRKNVEWVNWVAGQIELMRLPFNLVHVMMFAALAFVLRWSFRQRSWLVLTGWLVLFGALTEVVQWLVPGRQPRWVDFVGDVAGTVLGLALAMGARRATRPDHSAD